MTPRAPQTLHGDRTGKARAIALRAGAVLACSLAFVSCKDDPPPVAEASDSATSDAAATEAPPHPKWPPPKAVSKLDEELEPRAAGPVAADEPLDKHRKAALDILAGGEAARRLPTVATKPGRGWDSGLFYSLYMRRYPKVRMGATSLSNKGLPPEVVQRIVRQSYGRFHLCYEQALEKEPDLEGRVYVEFVIANDGSVLKATAKKSDLDDKKTDDCIVRAFYGLTFPKPERGKLTVLYPVSFSPG